MRERFRHLFPISTDALLRSPSVVVGLDANVLLAALRLPVDHSRQLVAVMGEIAQSGRLIVPHQAAREYARNFHVVAAENHRDAGTKRSRAIDALVKELGSMIGDADLVRRELEELLARHITPLAATSHPSVVSSVDIIELLESTIEKCILKPPIDQDVVKRVNEPFAVPGSRDAKKPDNQDGDARIWFELELLAAQRKCDFVFVTNEQKDDWLEKSSGFRNLRVDLREAFHVKTNGQVITVQTLSEFVAAWRRTSSSTQATPDLVESARTIEVQSTDSEPTDIQIMATQIIDYVTNRHARGELTEAELHASNAAHDILYSSPSYNLMYSKKHRARTLAAAQRLLRHLGDSSANSDEAPIESSVSVDAVARSDRKSESSGDD